MKPPTIAPAFACIYLGLCDVARARGYALAIHGSVVTDLDLVACPWTETAIPPDELAHALMEHIGACLYPELLVRSGLTEDQARQVAEIKKNRDPEPKPHGRLAWNLYMDAGAKVDLSVMPRLSATTPGDDAIVT